MMRFILFLAAVVGGCANPAAELAPAAVSELAPLLADAPFRDEIIRFEQADRTSPLPKCPVLFVGSSSIRLWSTLARDMEPLPVLNRGIGGSTITDVNRYFDRVVAPYRPRAIVFYAGENDIDSGQPPAYVADQFRRFMDRKWAEFGDVPVFYISAKPSKARAAQFARQSELNARIRTFASSRTDLTFVDVVPAMMTDGRPRDIFVEDGLHMSAAGYAIWREQIGRVLREKEIARARCPD